jgi:hypothetical protein
MARRQIARAFARVAAAASVVALTVPASAHAVGGQYAFRGGTAWERTQVRRALDVSSFDWNVIPGRITIHLARGVDSRSEPGNVWIDRDLLRAGSFAWAVVQDEYAHQIDYALFDDVTRARLTAALGGKAWCGSHAPGLRHSDYGCERFTSTFVWAYWPSKLNAYRPESRADEAAAMPARSFRRLVDSLLAERLAAFSTTSRTSP